MISDKLRNETYLNEALHCFEDSFLDFDDAKVLNWKIESTAKLNVNNRDKDCLDKEVEECAHLPEWKIANF
jgi:hypothetical protein